MVPKDKPRQPPVFLGLSVSDWLNLPIAISAVIAIALSTCQYTANLKRQDSIDRPVIANRVSYFTFDTTSKPLRVNAIFKIQNFGARLAYECTFKTVTVKKYPLSGEYTFVDQTIQRISNPIVPGVELDLQLDPINAEDSMRYYIKIQMNYNDVIANKTYSDSIYFKWHYAKTASIYLTTMNALEADTAKAVDNFIAASIASHQ